LIRHVSLLDVERETALYETSIESVVQSRVDAVDEWGIRRETGRADCALRLTFSAWAVPEYRWRILLVPRVQCSSMRNRRMQVQTSPAVVWDQNHPSNLVAWQVQAARVGATVRIFSVPVAAGSIEEVVDLFIAAVKKNRSMLG
jgi:O-succinylbenzoate synthase